MIFDVNIISALKDVTNIDYIKKDIAKHITNNLETLKEYTNRDEDKHINAVIEIVNKSSLRAADKKQLEKTNKTIIKIINKYKEKSGEILNKDNIDKNLTVDEIEEKLDNKITKYNKYTKNNPMKGISYNKKQNKYNVRYKDIHTSTTNLMKAISIILEKINEMEHTLDDNIPKCNKFNKNHPIEGISYDCNLKGNRGKFKEIIDATEYIKKISENIDLLPDNEISKEIITSPKNKNYLIKYKYKTKTYYDIQHILHFLKLKKSSLNEKYKFFSKKIKYHFWHPNKYGGFILRELISKNTVKKIIHQSHGHNIIELTEMLNINIFDDKLLRKETICVSQIIKVFNKERYKTQKPIGKYKIDLYFPDYKLAIECDEYNHKNRDKNYEKKRQEYIEKKLGCRFIRFDPDNSKFNILDVISQIHYSLTKK